MAVRNVVFVAPFLSRAMENVRAAAAVDVVRNPDTEVVIAATTTIIETIAIEYG